MLAPLIRRGDVSKTSLAKLAGWFTLSMLILYFLASTIYLLVRTQPEFVNTGFVSDESDLQTLVDEFARTVTRQDWTRNAQLFVPGSTLDFHRAFTFLTDFPPLSASYALSVGEDLGVLGSWGQQMAVFAGSLASNHLLIGNCRIAAGTHSATVDCIGMYSYTLNYDTSLFTNNFATQFVVFQPQFSAAKQPNNAWLLSHTTALINATNTILSSVETGAAPPGGVFVRRNGETPALRSAGTFGAGVSPRGAFVREEARNAARSAALRTPSDTWTTLIAQLDALIAQGQIDTARAICRTQQYVTLAATFDPYANDTSVQCNVIMRVPITLDSLMVCGPNGGINASCLVGPVQTDAIETINNIVPMPVTQDFTITGGFGISIQGGMHGLVIHNSGLSAVPLYGTPELDFNVTTFPFPSLTVVKLPQAANTVWAGPVSGPPDISAFRLLVLADIPLIPLASHVSGVLPLGNGGTNNAGPWSANRIVVTSPSGTQLTTAAALGDGVFLTGQAGGLVPTTLVAGTGISVVQASGTLTVSTTFGSGVTAVDLSAPVDIFLVTSGTITSTGTLSFVKVAQSANTVWAGPASGGAAAPTFRALVAADIPSTLTLSALTVTGPTSLGTSTTCVAPLSAPCYDISSQSCPGGYLGTNCINPDLVLNTLTVTTLTATDIMLLNGTIVVTGLSNFDAVNASTVYAGAIVLSGPMTCAPEDSITQDCYDISGITCTTPISSSCFPVNITLTDVSVTNTLEVNNVVCLGTPLGNDCVPSRVRTINGVSPSAAPALDFTVAAGTGISVTPIANGITVANTGVTSVALALPLSVFALSGTPVTTTGTLTGTLVSQAANTVWAAPNGSSGVPTFRTLALGDLTALGLLDDELLVGVTGGPPVATTLVAGNNVNITYGAGTITIAMEDSVGTGTVSSVGLALPAAVFSISGSPVTTTGTLTGAFVTQTANTVFAGPSSGGAAAPTFRAMTYADLPPLADGQLYIGFTGMAPVASQLTAGSLISITPGMGTSTVSTTALGSVTLNMPSAVFDVASVSGTNTQTLTVSFDTQPANTVFAGPASGGAATPTFRTLVTADLPVAVLLSYSEAADTSTISAFSAGSYTVATSMTLTPAAGTYWCSFSTSMIPSTSSGVYEVAMHRNSVIIDHTTRHATGSSSYFNVHTLAVITTPGGQDIDVRWKKTSGSGSADMRQRSLYCLRIG